MKRDRTKRCTRNLKLSFPLIYGNQNFTFIYDFESSSYHLFEPQKRIDISADLVSVTKIKLVQGSTLSMLLANTLQSLTVITVFCKDAVDTYQLLICKNSISNKTFFLKYSVLQHSFFSMCNIRICFFHHSIFTHSWSGNKGTGKLEEVQWHCNPRMGMINDKSQNKLKTCGCVPSFKLWCSRIHPLNLFTLLHHEASIQNNPLTIHQLWLTWCTRL